MRFGDQIDINQIDNWLITTRNMGDVINIPWSLFEELFNYKKTAYGLTYLKLRHLSQHTYGSFKTSDFKKISKCIGLSVKTLKSHISNLIELGWLKERHEGFYQLNTFHTKSYTKVLKLTAEQLFSVKNSANLDRTRLTFETRDGQNIPFKIVKIKEATSISLQEFRVLLTEIKIEIDSQNKQKYVKYYDRPSSRTKDLTSPTKWERDCTKSTRHIASRFVAKTVGISQRTILTYRKKTSFMNLSSYERRLFTISNPIIINAHSELKTEGLNDYAKSVEKQTKAQLTGVFFVNKLGILMKNQVAYRRSNLVDLKFTGIVRGTKKNKKRESNEEFDFVEVDCSTIPFYENEVSNEETEINENEMKNKFNKLESEILLNLIKSNITFLETQEVLSKDTSSILNTLLKFKNKEIIHNNFTKTEGIVLTTITETEFEKTAEQSLFKIINKISKQDKNRELSIIEQFELLKSIPEEFKTKNDEKQILLLASKFVELEKKINANVNTKGMLLRYFYTINTVPKHIKEFLNFSNKLNSNSKFNINSIVKELTETSYFDFKDLKNLFDVDINIKDKNVLESKELTFMNSNIKDSNFKFMESYIFEYQISEKEKTDSEKLEYLIYCFIISKIDSTTEDAFKDNFLAKLYFKETEAFWN